VGGVGRGSGPNHVPTVSGAIEADGAHVALQLPLGDQERVHPELLPEVEDRLPLANQWALRIEGGNEVLDARSVGGAEAQVVDGRRLARRGVVDRPDRLHEGTERAAPRQAGPGVRAG